MFQITHCSCWYQFLWFLWSLLAEGTDHLKTYVFIFALVHNNLKFYGKNI